MGKSKVLRAGIYILAAYGGCVLLDKKATKWLYAHKDAITESISRKIEKLIFGKTPARDYSKPYKPIYNKYYSSNRFNYADVSKCAFNADKIDNVFIALQDMIDEWGFVSVNDVLGTLDIVGKYTDTLYGWRDISNWDVHLERDSHIGNSFSAYLVPDKKPEVI